MNWTKSELNAIAREMVDVADATYWLFFRRNMGGKAHAFIEFCGLLGKYTELCAKAAAQGIDFTEASVHGSTPFPVEVHDMQYLGEKLRCIFGPMIDANPAARAALKRALFPEK